MSDISPDKDIDLSMLYEIADGSDEFIAESIGMFLEQSPEILREIEIAIAVNNWPAAATSAHKIKSNLGFFGMFNSQALIQEVEILSKSGAPNPNEVLSKFRQVKVIMADNMIELAKIKAEKEASL